MSTAAVSRVRRSAAKVMLVVVALVMSGLVASPSAGASDRGGYLALGDSVAFGYEPPDVKPDYFQASNFRGYPEYFASVAGLRLTNASCPGESTASMIDIDALSYACLNTPAGLNTGYRAMFPLHVNYSKDQSQLEFAVDYLKSYSDTRLVTLNIGANDVFLCQATAGGCDPEEQIQVLGKIGSNLATILATLRDPKQGNYSGPLVLLTYYSESYTDSALMAGTQALNSVLAATAKQFGASVADGYSAFKLASSRYNGDPCAAGLLIKLPSGSKTPCNIHPSVRGDWVLTAAVAVARLRASAFQSSAEQLESAVEEQPPAEVPSAVQEESPELQASLT